MMKAAILFESPGELVIEDIVIDEPQEHEVLIRVGAAGLCHSELRHIGRDTPNWNPTVLGHEGAGVVEAVGSSVTYVQPGDHVVGFCIPICGKCEFCLTGHTTLCQRVGIARPDGEKSRLSRHSGEPLRAHTDLGTFAEQMLVHENSIVKIDPSIPFDSAALVGCAVPTGLGAVMRSAKVPAGANVAVIGCGGIGLNVIQGAVLSGANRIIGIDINDGKLATAKRFGATDLINNTSGDAIDRVKDLLPSLGGVDYSFEALGLPETYELAFALLRPGGTATVMGLANGNISLPPSMFLQDRKLQGCSMGSVQFRKDLPFFIDLYMDGRLKLDELVSSRITLDQINEGYAAITDGSIARTVVVFD